MATSNSCLGIASFSLSTNILPMWYDLSLWTITESASTDLPFNKMEYYDLFISELKKIKFYLFNEELDIIDNGNRFLLINSKGYILVLVSQYYHRPLISNELIHYTERELKTHIGSVTLDAFSLIKMKVVESIFDAQ